MQSSSRSSKQLGQVLKDLELVTEVQIQKALEAQRAAGGLIGELLVRMGVISQEELIFGLAVQRGDINPRRPP
ncbi:MAG TPA: hypothetical protein VMU54_11805 [Planctomycetota bacterium]|nr:hypothetical protein [Planctomycetota bacterium]